MLILPNFCVFSSNFSDQLTQIEAKMKAKKVLFRKMINNLKLYSNYWMNLRINDFKSSNRNEDYDIQVYSYQQVFSKLKLYLN
jgi:hypothetical protein